MEKRIDIKMAVGGQFIGMHFIMWANLLDGIDLACIYVLSI